MNIIFNWWIKRKYIAWWCMFLLSPISSRGVHAEVYVAKYNYVLAAALDTGLALSAIIIFFCITYPRSLISWVSTFFRCPSHIIDKML